VSFAETMAPEASKLRGKPERFAEHYAQARLFFKSQTATEQAHIINAFRFELSRVQTPAVRERMVSGLMNVDRDLAEQVAKGLGMRTLPPPMPKVLKTDVTPEVEISEALSLMARPGDGSIAARRVALLVADGADAASLETIAAALIAAGAVPRLVGATLGEVALAGGARQADTTVAALPSVVWDAVVIPDGTDAIDRLGVDGRVLEFVKDQYRHCKPMLVLGEGVQLLAAAGIPTGDTDSGLIVVTDTDVPAGDFIAAIAKHRHFDRETDPPRV
jgi:catalase